MNPETLPTIHDRFFKRSMKQIGIAQGLSQQFLPERISFKIDYNSLQIEKDSGINSKLLQHPSDVLYLAEIEGTKQHVLLLFEHKSNLDKSVNLQNYQNISEVIDDVKHQSKAAPKKLPPVIPIIIYHGKSRWNIDNSMQPMFELVKGAEKFTPQQESIVIDLSIISDEKISGTAEVRAFMLTLKYSRSPLLFEKMPAIIHLFDGVGAKRLQYLDDLTTYLLYVTDQGKRSELSKIVQKELDLGDDIMRKFSNIWAELGYVAGLDDGEGVGIKKGEVRGFKKGEVTGFKKGEDAGFKKGEDAGFKKGKDTGFKKGEDTGFKKGEDVGFKKGIVHEKQLEKENEEKTIKSTLENTALKMLKKGISIEEICDFTGLSIEDVLVLKKKVEDEDR
jgi:predicted transposase YdaD